jgi:hypothetical protein
MSKVTNLQQINVDTYREGANVFTYQQYLSTPIARIRPNSKDILVYNGREVNDNFFDENLFDVNIEGAMKNAPSNYLEVRTLGDDDKGSPGFTDMTDFKPVSFLLDEGTVMYPSVLNAGGFADPAKSSGIIAMFETRLEIAKINYAPEYAKKGIKASLCFTAESIDKKFYPIDQLKSRSYSQENQSSKYFEGGGDDELFNILETITYPDQISSQISAFVDSCDKCIGANVRDQEISQALSLGTPKSPYLQRDWLSSAAGWTINDNQNGTDSIVYSDRM